MNKALFFTSLFQKTAFIRHAAEWIRVRESVCSPLGQNKARLDGLYEVFSGEGPNFGVADRNVAS